MQPTEGAARRAAEGAERLRQGRLEEVRVACCGVSGRLPYHRGISRVSQVADAMGSRPPPHQPLQRDLGKTGGAADLNLTFLGLLVLEGLGHDLVEKLAHAACDLDVLRIALEYRRNRARVLESVLEERDIVVLEQLAPIDPLLDGQCLGQLLIHESLRERGEDSDVVR